jgi:peptide-methionine (S)-S-oxide reductase
MPSPRLLNLCLSSFLAFPLLVVPALADKEAPNKDNAEAVFAGGCFWTMESDFEKVPGVIDAISGFSGGTVKNPTYEQVVQGNTGHLESVRVIYDPAQVSYAQLVEVFFHSIDPTQTDGQVCDIGQNYHSAIFVSSPEQKTTAEAAKADAAKTLKATIATQILPAVPFYAAGPEHQGFAKRNPAYYGSYRIGCGRDARLQKLWGDKAWPKQH